MAEITHHNDRFSTCDQLLSDDLPGIRAAGFEHLICLRPDFEGGPEQPTAAILASRAATLGLSLDHLPVAPGQCSLAQAQQMQALLARRQGRVLAFCRTGNRARQLYQMAQALPVDNATDRIEILIIGGGAAGIGLAASLHKRAPDLDIAIVEPARQHYYQPGWTLVGAGVFQPEQTQREMADLIPAGVRWITQAAARFDPVRRQVTLANGEVLDYMALVVCTGLELAWDAIEGLEESLGDNGVTSNYRYDLAPYTWQQVQTLRRGRALFTQPPMPIKCAGAPQKAMYLSCDHWRRHGLLSDIQVDFHNAGGVLFGVSEFVPPLMTYVKRYGIHLHFQSRLVRVDGAAGKAWFENTLADGQTAVTCKDFDLLHAVPPQRAPDVVRRSPLADAAGWCEVDPYSLQHVRHPDVFSLGDVCSSPNAKTAAAVRKQIVVVAENLLAHLQGQALPLRYDGYGSCPLTVEKGRIVLAEFGFGGKLLPTFPLDPTVPRRSAWWLKTTVLPRLYWHGMLRGHEWLAAPAQTHSLEEAAQKK